MWRHTAVLRTTALVLTLGVGCSAPSPGPKVPKASLPSYSEPAAPSSAPPAATSLGTAPQELRNIDWEHSAVPGDFCDIPHLINFTSGEATAQSRTWGKVHVGISPHDVTYGNVSGDSRTEAAVPVECDNGGGTAAGQLVFGYIVFASDARQLKLLGTITPQQNPSGVHTTLLGNIELAPGRVNVQEMWYRPGDPDCCPTGKATTTWTLNDDKILAAGPPHITS
jgi:hypothetical protein